MPFLGLPRLPLGQSTHHIYTRRVKTLRVALPAAAACMLAGVILWPHFDPAQAPKRHEAAAAPEMHQSHFSGIDKSNRPYSITADKAIQTTASGSNDVDLTKPVAEMTMQSDEWVALRADQGQYREEPGLITLQGDVHLYHDQGYDIDTAAAAIDLDKGVAWSDRPTAGHGPKGEISGEGFRLIQDGAKIVFTGKSRLVMRAAGDEAEPAPVPDPAITAAVERPK